MADRRSPKHGRRRALQLACVFALLSSGCNATFDIHEGKPQPICADPLLIDDMEDGVSDICALGERQGFWYTVGDGSSTDLTPVSGGTFNPTPIPGGRGTSHYAARMTGSGATLWGALMGFNLKSQDFGTATYDASGTGGIQFWMKSNAPVSVDFLIPDTVLPSNAGNCVDTATKVNCNNHFSFQITAPSKDWAEYSVPFSALTQRGSQTSGALNAPTRDGSATWNPKLLLGIQFVVPLSAPLGAAFDVWVDDVRFYYCATPTCTPTCSDPDFPKPCPATSGGSPGHRASPAGCRPDGTDCLAVSSWCTDPLLIDDMEDGDRAICDSGGREGLWFAVGDGTSMDFKPGLEQNFKPTPIEGGRGTSRYAARMQGSGFSTFAQMDFLFNAGAAGVNPYDASTADGIKFWVKSTVPVFVEFPIPGTLPIGSYGLGTCDSAITEENCFNPFRFGIRGNPNEWVEYELPFAALRQGLNYDVRGNLNAGSATWDPSRLVGLNFSSYSSAFDVSVDDVRFYSCPTGGCAPTCPADAPVACPASGGKPADCWPAGTDCSNTPDRVINIGVWGTGPSDVWAVGYSGISLSGTILHWNGTKWSSASDSATPPIWGVWGSGPSDVWAVADHGIVLRSNGSTWSATDSGTTSSFNAVWGSGPDDVWAIVYPGTILHWNGSAWSDTFDGAQFLGSIWGSGPNDVWAVGDAGTILHWDGSVWVAGTSGTLGLWSVWGSGPNDVWAVGSAGTVLHWTGFAWSAVTSPATQILARIWGSAPEDIWAVGDLGTVIHYDGSSWSPSTSGTTALLNGVWGSGPNDVWAVGSGSTILHWDGAMWSARQ